MGENSSQRVFAERSSKNPLKSVISEDFWSEWRDSNARLPAPKAGALPTGLHPDLKPEDTVSGWFPIINEENENFKGERELTVENFHDTLGKANFTHRLFREEAR